LSNTDFITSQTKPVFTGTSEANAAIQVLANDTIVGTGTADAAGRWNVPAVSALTEGTYSFTARSTDGTGNTSTPSTGLTLTIDTTPPTAPSIPGLSSSNDIRPSNPGVVAGVSTPTFDGHAEAGSLVELLVNGLPFGSGLATDGSWIIPVNQPLSEATYQVSAQATDLAGNKSPASAVLAVTINMPDARLTLARFQNTILLSWPSAADGYSLEAADSLDKRIWLPIDKTPSVEGDTRIVIVSLGSGSKFYRLKKQ
jgi:hypothetical protein